jgi:hypothetical protein
MLDGFLCSVYKDQARFPWCHEHPPSPTLHCKLPTFAHPEAEAAFLAIAACYPLPPHEEDDRACVTGVNIVVEANEGWSSTTWSCLPLER